MNGGPITESVATVYYRIIGHKMDFKSAVQKNCSCAKASRSVEQAEIERYGLQNVTLRSYQLDGLSWLAERLKCGHGCILGDEMGLGKTLQVSETRS